MLLKNKIDKKYRLKTNFFGGETLGFYLTKDELNGCRFDIYAPTAFEALILMSGSDMTNDYEHQITKFENWFNNNIGEHIKYMNACEHIAVQGRYENPEYLREINRYEEWATVIFNYLSDENHIKHLKYENYKLALCWFGAENIKFKGRNSFEVLESFAINHRKKTSNLEAHRYGLKKFITNFKMGMVNYFGFSCGGDDDFLDTLLELKIFKLDKGIVNETVL